MKNKLSLLVTLVCIFFISGCGSSTDSNSPGSGTTTVEATTYAVFGETFSNQVPAGLKTGGVNLSISASLSTLFSLAGTCDEDYTDCPYLTEANGADSMAGEILSRLWGIDYNDECTDDLFTAGTCFTCTDCSSGSEGSDYIIPTVLDDPDSCSTDSSGRYVNFGIDPCRFDSMIADIENMDTCYSVEGTDVDISSAIPWYTSWDIPQIVNFSGYQKSSDTDGGGMWWTINDGDSANTQYFVSLNSDWLYGGVKDTANDHFIFFGTGSPAYYSSNGEDEGINIAGYAGSLTESTQEFEVIQVRDQSPNSYIYRIKSNGTHIWGQRWAGDGLFDTPEEVATHKDSPTANRCVEIGSSIVSSKYVPLSECVTSFGKASVAELNDDDNFILKIIDTTTASSIDFSTALTSDTTSACAEEKTDTE